MRLSFALFAIVLAALSLVAVYREAHPPWKAYQRRYVEEAAVRGRTVKTGIRQDWLPALDRADRCRTCHLGVDDPGAPPEPPLAPHPAMAAHEPGRFGCTVCHGGKGPATRLPDAHQGLLPTRLLEARCRNCHDREQLALEAPTAVAGLALARRYHCTSCHRFAGEEIRKFAGPDLTGLAAKVRRPWLTAWIRDPRAYLPTATMGNFLLTDEDIADLSAYLLAPRPQFAAQKFLQEQEDWEARAAALDDDAYDALLDQGKTLFGRMRCLTCHRLGGKGGTLGPDLGRITLKTTRAWARAWLRNPEGYDSHTIMPTFTMSPAERFAVVEYLWDAALPPEDEMDEGREAAGQGAGPPGRAERGARLFVERGCYACHALPGVRGAAEFAPSLARLAALPLKKIVFGPAPIPHTLADYVAAKLQAPRIFAPHLKMPRLGLTPLEVGRITTAVVGMDDSIPAGLRRAAPPRAVPLPAGEAGVLFRRFKCLSCHRIGAAGGDLAPDLTVEGSRVRRAWLRDFLLKPSALRPFLTERMPRFNMTSQEAGVLADYFAFARRDNRIDRRPVAAGNPEAGARLYRDIFSCRSCHALGETGGYYGPALDQAGVRLRPAWILTRLDDSHAFTPGAREPEIEMSAQQRRDLTAFLMTLGRKTGEGAP